MEKTNLPRGDFLYFANNVLLIQLSLRKKKVNKYVYRDTNREINERFLL